MSLSFAGLRDAVRTTLWPIPTMGVLAAVVLGVLLPRLDKRIDGSLPPGVASALFDGDSGAARTVLDAVSSSMITVTSLTFSLTVVTLQLASSQFSPRLLRTFTRDLFVQNTLALFLATFTYSLTVLRGIRTSGDGGASFVPRMAVTLSFLLAVASVLALVLFLAHLAQQIRVETMLRDVHADATGSVRSLLDRHDEDAPGPPEVRRPGSSLPVLAATSGFLNRVEEESLRSLSEEYDAVVAVDVYPGAFLVERVPIGQVWSRSGARLEPAAVAELVHRVAGCLHTGFERTSVQDVGYGLRQLVDIANKALSPGINDPTTAIHALGHVSVLLCDLADRQLGDVALRDEEGRARVLLHRPDLATLLEDSLSQPRRYGASDPQVVMRLFHLLSELGARVRAEQSPLVLLHLERLLATVAAEQFDATERALFATLEQRVRRSVDPAEPTPAH